MPDACRSVHTQARQFVPCALNGIHTRVNLIDDKLDKILELVVTGMVVLLDPSKNMPGINLSQQQIGNDIAGNDGTPAALAISAVAAPAAPCLLPRGLALYLQALSLAHLPGGDGTSVAGVGMEGESVGGRKESRAGGGAGSSRRISKRQSTTGGDVEEGNEEEDEESEASGEEEEGQQCDEDCAGGVAEDEYASGGGVGGGGNEEEDRNGGQEADNDDNDDADQEEDDEEEEQEPGTRAAAEARFASSLGSQSSLLHPFASIGSEKSSSLPCSQSNTPNFRLMAPQHLSLSRMSSLNTYLLHQQQQHNQQHSAPPDSRNLVDLTPLTAIPGTKTVRYLGKRVM